MPLVLPVTTPEEEPMEAVAPAELLHVPLADASLKLVVNPAQTWAMPEIVAGKGFTVTTAILMHPVPSM